MKYNSKEVLHDVQCTRAGICKVAGCRHIDIHRVSNGYRCTIWGNCTGYDEEVKVRCIKVKGDKHGSS